LVWFNGGIALLRKTEMGGGMSGDERGEADSREGCSETAYNCMHEMHEMHEMQYNSDKTFGGDRMTRIIYALCPVFILGKGLLYFATLNDEQSGIGKAGLF
jgi:hypothetical protein